MEDSTGIQCSQYAVKHIQQMNRALASLYENDCAEKNDRYQKLREVNNYRDPTVAQFHPGDRVLVKMSQLKGDCSKLTIEWRGIYIIHKRVDVNVFSVFLQNNERRKFLIHQKRLKKLPAVQEQGSVPNQETSPKKGLEESPSDSQEVPKTSNSTDIHPKTEESRPGCLRSGKKYVVES